MVEAIVLAGSKNEGRLRPVSDAPYEALVPVAGQPMVNYVLQALEDAGSVQSVILVGPEPEGLDGYPKVSQVVAPRWGGSPMDTLALGLSRVPAEAEVLVTTADLPLLSGEAVEDFLARARDLEGELYYAVVPQQANNRVRAGIKKTYVRLQEGVYTGGNLFFFHTRIVSRCWEFVSRIARVRKSPWQMARLLGLGFIARLLAGRLTVEALENRVQEILGVRVRAVITPHAGVGLDVDKPADYHLAENLLAQDVAMLSPSREDADETNGSQPVTRAPDGEKG